MNAWEFAAAALWPAVVLIAILVLRRPLGELVRNVRHATLPGGVEFDVGKLEEATEEAIAAQPAPAITDETPSESRAISNEAVSVTADLAALAELSPAAVVMNSWRTIETALRRLYDAASSKEPSGSDVKDRRVRPGPMAMIADLRQRHYISDPTSKLLRELRRLRNAVAHEEEEPHVGAALAYAESADTAIRLLDLTTETVSSPS